MKWIVRWFRADAEWWEFWKPCSGLSGGAIMGGLLSALMVAASRLAN